MIVVRKLLVSPRTAHTNRLLRAFTGNADREQAFSLSGVGTGYWLHKIRGLAVVTMNHKGNYKQQSSRIRKAYRKLPSLGSVGVIYPGTLERYMRGQPLLGGVPDSLYFLTSAEYTRIFTGVPDIPHPASIDAVFAVPAPPRAKKRAAAAPAPPDVLSGVKARVVEAEVVEDEQEAEREACAVCMENRITHMCLPCTHFVLCGVCSSQLADCPVCRQKVQKYLTPIRK